MEYIPIRPEHDAAIAAIVRRSLKKHGLDIPGTAYFDESLDHLSAYYAAPGRAYFVLVEDGAVVGGVGLSGIDFFPACAELQKLYLAEKAQGRGLGYDMLAHIEAAARGLGYRRLYLETHTNLRAALHLYEKTGYQRIPRPEAVVHSTMDRFFIKEL